LFGRRTWQRFLRSNRKGGHVLEAVNGHKARDYVSGGGHAVDVALITDPPSKGSSNRIDQDSA
jgi:hypothetical protein